MLKYRDKAEAFARAHGFDGVIPEDGFVNIDNVPDGYEWYIAAVSNNGGQNVRMSPLFDNTTHAIITNGETTRWRTPKDAIAI